MQWYYLLTKVVNNIFLSDVEISCFLNMQYFLLINVIKEHSR